MIPQVAIKRFLRRPLDSHTWIKKLTRDELWNAVEALRPRPKLNPSLKNHQLACFLLGVSYPQFSFWLDLGAGKSLLMLELIRYWRQCKRLRRAIVLVKSDKAFLTWEEQIRRWNINVPYVCLEGSSEQKWQQLNEFGDGIVIVARPGARAMLSTPVKVKRKVKWELDDKLVQQFAKGVDALIQDESTDDAHHTSLTHKMVRKLDKYITVRYALAGRPFGRDPTLLWGQQKLIDGGATLGETLGLFRAAFFTEDDHPFIDNKHIKQHTFKKSMTPALHRMLKHRSIAYSSVECGIKVKSTTIVEQVRFPEEASAYYKKAVDAIIAAKGNLREVKNIFLRMRQLSSGFVGFKDDETGERAEVEFDDNPKFDRTLELIEEVPYDTKTVVFYEFTHSGRKLYNAMKERGWQPIWLWSGTKDSRKELQRFHNSDRCRVAVINWRVGAYSLDGLQDVASYGFMYESPVGAIDREQAEKRLARQGQKKPVTWYDVIVKGSADAKILAYHREADGLLKAVLRDPKVLVGGTDG